MNDIQRQILNTADSLLLVIDLQERLAAAMDQHELQRLICNVAILLDSSQELGLPVLVTEQYVKGLGPTLPALKEKAGHASFHEKISFSCCGNDDFMAKLKATGKKQIIVCGTEAHVCVLQTVLDLLAVGYTVHVVKDAVMSRSPDNKQTAMEAMTLAGAHALIRDLCKFSRNLVATNASPSPHSTSSRNLAYIFSAPYFGATSGRFGCVSCMTMRETYHMASRLAAMAT